MYLFIRISRICAISSSLPRHHHYDQPFFQKVSYFFLFLSFGYYFLHCNKYTYIQLQIHAYIYVYILYCIPAPLGYFQLPLQRRPSAGICRQNPRPLTPSPTLPAPYVMPCSVITNKITQQQIVSDATQIFGQMVRGTGIYLHIVCCCIHISAGQIALNLSADTYV